MARYTPPPADPAVQAANQRRITTLEAAKVSLTRAQRLALTPATGMTVIETDTGLHLNFIPGLGWRTATGQNPDALDIGVY
ncbi:hypothetical protein Q0M94_28615 (plasmid) [Deinococcus radiomollis]|uniref:hypothetical protein n=1 Tax=Deinococcus radiomollis TaxID=468916 RepID=UPI0038912780